MSAMEDLINALTTAEDQVDETIASFTAVVDRAADAVAWASGAGLDGKTGDLEALKGRLEELVTAANGLKDTVGERTREAVAIKD